MPLRGQRLRGFWRFGRRVRRPPLDDHALAWKEASLLPVAQERQELLAQVAREAPRRGRILCAAQRLQLQNVLARRDHLKARLLLSIPIVRSLEQLDVA